MSVTIEIVEPRLVAHTERLHEGGPGLICCHFHFVYGTREATYGEAQVQIAWPIEDFERLRRDWALFEMIDTIGGVVREEIMRRWGESPGWRVVPRSHSGTMPTTPCLDAYDGDRWIPPDLDEGCLGVEAVTGDGVEFAIIVVARP